LAEAHGGLSVDSNLSIPYTQISKEKLGACRALKLVDPKATATTKEGSVNRIFKDTNLPSYNWSNETKELFKAVGTVIDLGNSIPPDFSGLTWPGVNNQKLFENLIT
jgi:hypothetical protein